MSWRDFDYAGQGVIESVISKEQKGMPTVGQGFQKCIALIGAFTQDQTYDYPGTADETSLATAAHGYATWRKATNETWAFHDNGSSWRDFGNHGDGTGAMKVVSGPFP
jgi:hypothetical protein